MTAVNVSGGIVFDSDEDFREGTAYVKLLDASKHDAPSETIAEEIIRNVDHKVGEQIQFSLSGEITDPRGFYIVSVHIDRDNDGDISKGDYITTGYYPVAPQGDSTGLTITVTKVTS